MLSHTELYLEALCVHCRHYAVSKDDVFFNIFSPFHYGLLLWRGEYLLILLLLFQRYTRRFLYVLFATSFPVAWFRLSASTSLGHM